MHLRHAHRIGSIFCIGSAIGFVLTNILLRWLAVQDSPVWCLCLKEGATTLLCLPWVIYGLTRGSFQFPRHRSAGLLALSSIGSGCGNVAFMWAMSVVGLAITTTASQGVNLVASAAIGWLLLGERVTARAGAAIVLLIGSVACLSLGAKATNASIAASSQHVATGPFWITMAILGVCAAGIVYANLAVAIRRAGNHQVPLAFTAIIPPFMNVVLLVPVSLFQEGPGVLAAMPSDVLAITLLAGAVNFASFLALVYGLRLVSVVQANTISASQVAMASVAGLLFFGEAAGLSAAQRIVLTSGIALTIVGMILISRPEPHSTDAS